MASSFLDICPVTPPAARRHSRRAAFVGAALVLAVCLVDVPGSGAAGSSTDTLVRGISLTRTPLPATSAFAPSAPVASVPTAVGPVAVPTTVTTTTVMPTTVMPTTVMAITQSDRRSLRQAVLAAIGVPLNGLLPGWRIEFLTPKPGYRGSTFPASRRIEIYPRAGESFDELVHVTAHEMGHAVDVTYLDDAGRARFAASRGRPGASPWWVGDGADDFASGAGDWAECFAWLETGRGPWFSRLGQPPTNAQLGVMRQLVP